jgi:hypothetical protein
MWQVTGFRGHSGEAARGDRTGTREGVNCVEKFTAR